MPVLQWLTRDKDLRAAGRAPYRLLEEAGRHGDGCARNMLIQGDNLHALKALLPYYAGKVKDTGGVYLVPAFTGLGAPHWDMYARGCLIGLTRGTTREHIIRAAQESIAYQVNDLLTAMKRDTGTALSSLSVDGGASRDSFLMQFQSDISDCTIRRPVIRETTALGACYLAGLATGVGHSREELKQLWRCDTLYAPSMDENKRRKLLSGWDKAVGRSLDWAEH